MQQETLATGAMPDATARPNFLLVARHDYRTERKAGCHFLVDELARIGHTRFFSCTFSRLSRFKGDTRLPLADRANRVETTANGVETYLWRTLIHPCRVPGALAPLMNAYVRHYGSHVPETFARWIREADVILFETGGPELFHDLVKRLNPRAMLVYLCSDSFDAINPAPYVRELALRHARSFDKIMVKSPLLARLFPPGSPVFLTSQGFDKAELRERRASPFAGGVNLVSVGNMLFDPEVFRAAAPAFPDATFHVIGGGPRAQGLADLPNVRLYGEMPFSDTLAYLQHADAGLAPYGAGVEPYLADTSLKLGQYRVLGLPAVCPEAVTGGYPGRFGYNPGEADTVRAAVAAALAHGRFPGVDLPSWREVALDMLRPPADPAAVRVA
ncbi:UDP-glucuronate:glycolipid 2-beta-glucuronosyltransferase [uncultured Alphaproteobacteria bacterium]|uniref:UDP-glucuronate:glycolipid 2-beta-glucuronosyltransferase n=1 Tax=uncultured Alphaproteobacteria bacterium TaxID=91750 RepID=A0A212JHX7_9PROT|nr:UDP-glucuronate:glycolipid 2-beta-glucuronosyltransferase [uncultured Alphaproteobacteria bacterium]